MNNTSSDYVSQSGSQPQQQSFSSSSSKLRIVPPSGRYGRPFMFAVWHTGGGDGDGTDHGPMLFSPYSSSPSGFYEAGGTNNNTSSADVILKDCTLLLTVTDAQTRQALIAAQEAPLGEKFELPCGQFRVVAQLTSFGGRVFSTAEAHFDVVDTFEDRSRLSTGSLPPLSSAMFDFSHQDASSPLGLASSSVHDVMYSMRRNGGLPPSRSGQGGHTSTRGDITFASGSGAGAGSGALSASEQIAATVRQSEEVVSQAIQAAAGAGDQGRISRTSSVDSKQSPKSSRPPLGAPSPSRSGAGPHDDSKLLVPESSEMDVDGNTDLLSTAHFIVPFPAFAAMGAHVCMALRAPAGRVLPQFIGETTPLNVLIQEQNRTANRGRDGATHDHHHHHHDVSPAVLSEVLAVRRALPMVARGVQMHFETESRAGEGMMSCRRGHTLVIEPTSASAAAGQASCVIAGRSLESFSLSEDGGVLSGMQFGFAQPVRAATALTLQQGGRGHCSAYNILFSLRPRFTSSSQHNRRDAAASHEETLLAESTPYLEADWDLHRRGVVLRWWRPMPAESRNGGQRNTNTNSEVGGGGGESQLLWEGVVAHEDTVSILFSSNPLLTGYQQSMRGAERTPTCMMVLMVNFVTVSVCDMLAPLQWLDSPRGGSPTQLLRVANYLLENVTSSQAVVVANCSIGGVAPSAPSQHQPQRNRMTSPSGGSSSTPIAPRGGGVVVAPFPILERMEVLSHHHRVADVARLPLPSFAESPTTAPTPPQDYSLSSSSSGSSHHCSVYLWKRGTPLTDAVESHIVLY